MFLANSLEPLMRPTVRSGKEAAACVESTAPDHVITCPVHKCAVKSQLRERSAQRR